MANIPEDVRILREMERSMFHPLNVLADFYEERGQEGDNYRVKACKYLASSQKMPVEYKTEHLSWCWNCPGSRSPRTSQLIGLTEQEQGMASLWTAYRRAIDIVANEFERRDEEQRRRDKEREERMHRLNSPNYIG